VRVLKPCHYGIALAALRKAKKNAAGQEMKTKSKKT